MPFFKSTANLPDGEKARIEFHLQQIAECIGFDRFKLPVVDEASLRRGNNPMADQAPGYQSPDQIKMFVGEHLGHDVSGIRIQTFLMLPEETGGG